MKSAAKDVCECCGSVADRPEAMPRLYNVLFDDAAAGTAPKVERLCLSCFRHRQTAMKVAREECCAGRRFSVRRQKELAAFRTLLAARGSITPDDLAQLLHGAPCSIRTLAAALRVHYRTLEKALENSPSVSMYFAGVFEVHFGHRLVPGEGGRLIYVGRPTDRHDKKFWKV